jgi:nucleotide-binding universal stress UspA family protein
VDEISHLEIFIVQQIEEGSNDMFKRILVPLDGSPQAEQAIPLAARLARTTGGTILLVQVVDTLTTFGAYSVGAMVFLQELLEKDLIKAASYLAEVATSNELKNIKTRIAVFSGQVGPQIIETAQQQEIDVIVLCSHGYTGLKRWALGSVAQKVARESSIPVLLVRAQNLMRKEKMAHSLRTLVALDGSCFAEAALLPTAQLVEALCAPEKGELHLIQLINVPTIEEEFGYILNTDFNFRQTALQTAGNYLQLVREDLLKKLPAQTKVYISWSVEECKNVADTLIQIAESGNGIGMRKTSDLIALTTHGRSGLQRWILGSTTERVLQGSTLPLFIVHPPKASQKRPAEKDESRLVANVSNNAER